MDGVAVSEEQITSIDSIAEGVRGLRIAFVNVFAVTHPDGSWSLIDAALPLSASHIRSWAEAHFATPPNALILTHGHFDHVSAAKELAEGWDIPIFAHCWSRRRNDDPFIAVVSEKTNRCWKPIESTR